MIEKDEYKREERNIKYFARLGCRKTINDKTKILQVEYNPFGTLFAYNTSDSLKIYDSAEGTLKTIITASFDHYKFFQEFTLLYPLKDKIFYLSTFDNKHLAVFDTNKCVTSLSVDTENDLFMTSSAEGEFSIFDINCKNPVIKIIEDSTQSIGSIGPTNKLAISKGSFIKINDKRNFSKI